jgi:hypothetical protein
MQTLFQSNNCLYASTGGHVVEGVGLKLRDCGRSPVHILLKTRMPVTCVCSVSCRWHLHDKVITCSGESHHMCVSMCDLGTLTVSWPRSKQVCCTTQKKSLIRNKIYYNHNEKHQKLPVHQTSPNQQDFQQR